MPVAENEKSKVLGLSMWPISNLVGMSQLEKPKPETLKKLKPSYKIKGVYTSLTEWIQGIIRFIPFYSITLATCYFYPIEQQMEESQGAIKDFMKGDTDLMKHGWILKIMIRDLIVSGFAGLIWQTLIIDSWMTPKLRPLKFNKDYQHRKHLDREIFYSFSTILCGTLWEVVIMYMYAAGYCNTWYMDWNQHKLSRAIMIITMGIWRDGYFYWCHRFMHDWDTQYIPDFGKVMYKYAHALHHKSRNIQPWSGISMHPIEGLIYETAVFLVLPFAHHPVMINLIKIDLNYAAILGHDGHEYPAAGDWFHTVHHMKIKGNYGSPNCPFDWLFGTVDYGEDLDVDDQTQKLMKVLEAEEKNEGKKAK